MIPTFEGETIRPLSHRASTRSELRTSFCDDWKRGFTCTAINWADFVSWWMWFNGYTHNSTAEFSHECILLPLYVYNIHRDTKSARLIAVCKRSFKGPFTRAIFAAIEFSFWCMWLNGLTYECSIRPSVQSYINQYFCDSTTQSHASEWEKSPQKSLNIAINQTDSVPVNVI